MTLQEKISLVDQMIKENRDYRIVDYLELVAELERIEDASKKYGFFRFYKCEQHLKKVHKKRA